MFDSARDRSTVAGLASGARDRLRTAVDGSVIVRVFFGWYSSEERDGDESESTARSGLERALANSTLIALVPSGVHAGTRIRRGKEGSRFVGVGTRIGTSLESSVAYRWLTSEPDPEVIVIDLRETRAVGPLIRTVDRAGNELEARTATSTVVSGSRRLVSVVRKRPIRAVSAVVLTAVFVSSLLVVSLGSSSEPLLLGQLLVAGLAALGLRSRSSLKGVLETRLGQSVVAAFEPPEPPERVTHGEQSRQAEEHSEER